jgi:sec-independent protein translocase protein TatC
MKNTLTHWLDLRKRLLRWLCCFALCFFVCFYYSDTLFHYVLMPLLKVLPGAGALVLTKVGSSLFLPIDLAILFGLFLSAPYGLFELWQFILPALYLKERRWGGAFLVGSLTLFMLGAGFCYKIILPWMFSFLVEYSSPDLRLMLDARDAISLTLQMISVFGLCFQVPIVCVLLVQINVVTVSQLINMRRYVIVGAFIVGMLLAPPDVLSQTLIALPLCFLYEIGLLCARWLSPLPLT